MKRFFWISFFLSSFVMLWAPLQGREAYNPGKVLIMFDEGVRGQISIREVEGVALSGIPSLDELNRRFGVERIERVIRDPDMDPVAKGFGLDLIYLFSLPEGLDIPAVSEVYGQDPNVFEATPDYRIEPYFTPNDSLLGNQWGLFKTEALGAWDVQQGDLSIVIAIIDDGLDWNHVDLYDNYVTGWDFVGNDPDPTPAPGDEHGTHCAGIASAVTNNGEGVASMGFSCGLMGLRTFYCSQCVSAIYYAANNGAKVISMSWGCPASSSFETALNYSNSMGLVNCAAAGNDNAQTPHYPAYYNTCVAVAASDPSDMKADFSNYGTWIEVCAPGVGIWSTIPGNGYASLQGTSMACPFAAGLFGLVFSQFPDSSNDWVKNLVFSTCDSMPDPLYSSGLLGYGRINALKAVGTSAYCWLELSDFAVIDTLPGCDNDGRAEAGETVELVCTLSNRADWRDATGVSCTISTSYPGITIDDPNSSFPDIPNGSTGDNSSNPFVFSVADPFDPHRVNFTLAISASPASYNLEDTVATMVGHPSLVLVDDDLGMGYERNFQEPLDALDVPFDDWEILTQGAMGSELANYEVAIWFTGDDATATLTPSDITDLTSFLDGGGKLFITGQNIGEDIGSDPFYANYLKASYVGNTTDHTLDGVPGDSLGDGLTLATSGGDPSNQDSEDIISLLSGADSSFVYAPGQVAALRYDSGTYKLVYFGFGFEAINKIGPFAGRDTVLARILRWFGVPVGVQERANFEFPISNVRVYQNFPNPLTRSTTITYHLTQRQGDAGMGRDVSTYQHINLSVYDLAGRLVRTLVDGEVEAGIHSVSWDGRDNLGRTVPAGIYFYALNAGDFRGARKAVFLE